MPIDNVIPKTDMPLATDTSNPQLVANKPTKMKVAQTFKAAMQQKKAAEGEMAENMKARQYLADNPEQQKNVDNLAQRMGDTVEQWQETGSFGDPKQPRQNKPTYIKNPPAEAAPQRTHEQEKERLMHILGQELPMRQKRDSTATDMPQGQGMSAFFEANRRALARRRSR